ncbi:MAG: methyltransferase domain-containing protein [Chloroflexota bacterium]
MKCIVCHSDNTEIAVNVPQVPVLCNILWPSREEALAVPKVDIELAFCHNCGHLFNPHFDPSLMVYTQEYENSLHFSARFQEYAESLVADLIERHDLRGKDIVELGCGKGDFLQLICEKGGNRGVGFDKSYVPEPVTLEQGEVTFIQDWYSEQYADYAADFICCRHVLEHIEDPYAYLMELRQIIGERRDVTIFFEVPNALFTLQDLAIWDIIYEHCSYYSKYSLEALFARCGFQVTNLYDAYEGQFLCIEATPSPETVKPTLNPADLLADLRSFAQRYEEKTTKERETLARMEREHKKAVVWGAGSKGITFLNMLGLQDQIQFAIDINPRKQSMFVTGAGQQIVSPADMANYEPDVIIVMNPVYINEIKKTALDLGVDAEYMLV